MRTARFIVSPESIFQSSSGSLRTVELGSRLDRSLYISAARSTTNCETFSRNEGLLQLISQNPAGRILTPRFRRSRGGWPPSDLRGVTERRRRPDVCSRQRPTRLEHFVLVRRSTPWYFSGREVRWRRTHWISGRGSSA